MMMTLMSDPNDINFNAPGRSVMQKVIHSDFDLLFLKVNSFATVTRISGSKCDRFFLPISEGTHKTPRLRVMCCTKKKRCNVRNLSTLLTHAAVVTEDTMKYLKLFLTFKRHESHVKHLVHWVVSMQLVLLFYKFKVGSIICTCTRLSSFAFHIVKRIRCFPVLHPFGHLVHLAESLDLPC